ncbi:MAG: VWA domain-containing protein [Sphingomonadaceae bacterium]
MNPLGPLPSVLFTDPLWLLALPPAAALLVVARLPWWRAARRAGKAALRQEARRLGLRLAWIALLLLALSGLTLTRPLDRQALLFVVDASASVVAVRDQAEAAVRAAASRMRDGDLLGVVAAAAGARVEEVPTDEPLFDRLSVSLPDTATDLAAGLRLAGALLPEGYAGRLVVASDGRQTRGDALAAARDLAARGIVVDVLPLGTAAAPDLRLESVALPETAYRGEVATLTARLHSDRSTTATLRVYRDDQLLLERRVDLRAGRQEVVLSVPVGDPGLHRYRVDLSSPDPSADGTTANNALGAIQRVVGPPRVLVVASSPEEAGMLPSALSAGGAEVSVVGPAGVPADLAGWARYDSAVLVDVPAESLPAGTMDLLERYVRDMGRGLVMTGGPDSFGPGGYADTPVERALPVYMDLRGRGRQPRVALALVIDKSGSMSGAKMEMAKEAAARSVGLLRPGDRAAVLAFDSVPQWVAPLTPVEERESLEQAIGSIYAAGGTEIYPALAAGFDALRDVEADVKHLLLLTDGRSGSGGDYGALVREMRDARVSLSTVAVGSDADTGLLEAMARAGRGRYHFTADPADIPQIFMRETLMATRTLLVNRRFYPAAASEGPLLRGVQVVPPLDGYVAVTAKEQAEVVLVSPEGDPVLATWQYGLGRAAAWTPDVAGRWSGAWAGIPTTTILWGNLLSWLLPPQEAGELSVRVDAEGDTGFEVVAENRGGWEELRSTRATLLGPDGRRREMELSPAGPGRYRARGEMPEPGAYVVQVSQTVDGGELRGEAGWVAPYPAEYREVGVDHAFLRQLAAAGGGELLGKPEEAAEPRGRTAVSRWPGWPFLIALAAILWPLEIAARRLVVPAVARGRGEAGTGTLPLPLGEGQGEGKDAGDRRSPLPLREGEGKGRGSAPALDTAGRLLERKRALREGRREKG